MSVPCIMKEELEQMYTIEKQTDQQIADVVGCVKQSVYRLRKRYGIKKIPGWSRHICEPTQRQLDIIYGTLMGDGHLENRNTQRNSESNLQITHAIGQKSYVNWKYLDLGTLVQTKPKESVRDGGGSVRFRFRTFAHPFFSDLRKEFYPEARKIVTKYILDKLSALSVAVWFMDDGTNLGQGSTFRFSTCSFSDEEHERIIAFFSKKFDIRTLVSYYDGYPILRVYKDDKRQFVDLIKSHIPRCMQYKVKVRNRNG